MSIYDRDYYRETGGYPSFANRFQASTILALVYVCFFVLQVTIRDGKIDRFRHISLTERLELKTSKVLDGELWRVITYVFVHDPTTVVPLVLTVVFLIVFGRQLERLYGWKEFLAFFLLSGFFAGLAFTLTAAVAKSDEVLTGPVGSVSAGLLLFALQYPRRTVLLFFVNPWSIWVLWALYVAYNLVQAESLQVAVSAQSAAGAFASFYCLYSLRLSNWLPRMPSSSVRSPARPRLQVFRDEPVDVDGEKASMTAPASATYASAHAPSTAPANAPYALLDEHLEAKLDEVLKKVNKSGQDSLTDEERAVLFRASEIYRKRRKT
jgi:membrane associated rhomboid family serine protease